MWISKNPRLLEAVSIINKLPTPVFSKILYHTITKTIDTLDKQLLNNFNETEQNLILQSINHIYKKSSVIVIKPVQLQNDLTGILNLQSEKAAEFVKLWTNELKKNFEDLDTRKKVDNIAWELNLQSANSSGDSNLQPKVRLQLKTSDFAGNDAKKVTFELGEEELLQLYGTLENIQSKYDEIRKLEANKK